MHAYRARVRVCGLAPTGRSDSPSVISARKESLAEYLRRLLAMPRMLHNPDVLRFLGLV